MPWSSLPFQFQFQGQQLLGRRRQKEREREGLIASSEFVTSYISFLTPDGSSEPS